MTILKTAAVAAFATVAATGSASALSISNAWADCDAATAADLAALIGAVGTLDCGTTADRQDLSNVNLGAGDGDFFSLGLNPNSSEGGVAVFEIAPAFMGPASVVEVTNPSNHLEAAAVFVGTELTFDSFVFVGIVDNGSGGSTTPTTSLSFTGTYNYIAFLDVSRDTYGNTASIDGFDLDAFSVTPVPVPAGVLLLGTAIAGLGLTRRKA